MDVGRWGLYAGKLAILEISQKTISQNHVSIGLFAQVEQKLECMIFSHSASECDDRIDLGRPIT